MSNNSTAIPTHLFQAINRDLARFFSPKFEHTRLVALSVDPLTIHVYWSITQEQRQPELYQTDSGISLVLRFHPISPLGEKLTTINESFEVKIKPSECNRYIQLQQDGQSYLVELGIHSTLDNSFKTLAQSTLTTTPQAGLAREDQAVIFIDHRDPYGIESSLSEILVTSLNQLLDPAVPQNPQTGVLSLSSSSSLG